MSIFLTKADLAALQHYPLSLQQTARALWSSSNPVPADQGPCNHASSKRKQKGAS